jgi:hypothetical protein
VNRWAAVLPDDSRFQKSIDARGLLKPQNIKTRNRLRKLLSQQIACPDSSPLARMY